MAHPWFDNLDVSKFFSEEMKAPITPEIEPIKINEDYGQSILNNQI